MPDALPSPTAATPTGAELRRGPLLEGDRVHPHGLPEPGTLDDALDGEVAAVRVADVADLAQPLALVATSGDGTEEQPNTGLTPPQGVNAGLLPAQLGGGAQPEPPRSTTPSPSTSSVPMPVSAR